MKKTTFLKADKNSRHGRRRGTARLFVLGTALVAATAAGGTRAAHAQTAAQSTASVGFDIQPGPVSDVIAAFQAATGTRVSLAHDSIGQIQSAGVVGRMTPERALQTLLAGTSLAFRAIAPGQFELDVEGQSESVEVTAGLPTVQSPKYPVPLRDIAQSIALVPRDVIEQQGAVTLSDVMRNVPGITLQAGEGGGASNAAGDMFNMRGFNASNSLFVDGVRDDGLISRDVFNLEQVEVFMGPTGSDVGRGSASGYVNMQTKTPHMGREASAMLTLGSSEERRLSADFNLAAPTVHEDAWARNAALRLNVLWQDSGVPGRDAVTRASEAVAPSLALGIGTPTRITLGAQIMRQDNLPDYGIPGAAWNTPLTDTTTLTTRPVDQSNYYGTPAYDYDRASQDTYTARVEHDVTPRVTVRNQTRYNRTHREAVVSAIQNVAAFNPETSQVTIARQGNERENTVLSNQTSVNARFSTGRLRHAANVGLELAAEEQFAPALTGLGTRPPVDIFAPNTNDVVTGFAPARTIQQTLGNTTTIALYAFDSVELNDRWQVSGGLRWERYDTQFESIAATGVATDLAAEDSLVSGKGGILFRATENGNVYASVGTSLTPPGGANFTLSTQPNNVNSPSVDPQKSTNYEVGTKWDLANGRLSVNGALFHTRNENVIFTVDATAIPPVFNQDDEQLVTGFTVGALGRVTDRWDLIANFGYLDSEFRSQGEANNGRRLLLTPAGSGSLWSTYRLPLGQGLTLGGGIRFTGSAFINAANTIELPAYHLVDALAEYPVNAVLSLRLNVYNVTNERYIRSINNNGGRYNPGNPRSAAVTLRVRY